MKNTENIKKTNEKLSVSESIFEWIKEFAVAMMLIVALFTVVFRMVTVSGDSMNYNYYSGDRLITYILHNNYKQGDVVIVTDVLENPIIKRVIATEGQTVNIDGSGSVYVDGIEIDNTKYNVPNGITYAASYDCMEFPQVVPENCYFVLGDNRLISLDSRYEEVGMVDSANILGKAYFRIFPYDSFGVAK